MKLNLLFARDPLIAALLFQGALVPFALLLAWAFGLAPWNDMALGGEAVFVSVVATVPPLVSAWWLSRQSFAWSRRILELVDKLLDLLFRHRRSQTAIAAISLLAGFGEELLFRGVIQAGLEQPAGAVAALVIASLLFGLAHAVTLAYFVLSTLMGMYLGILYQVTGNLLIVCLVHAFYDWVAVSWYLRRAGAG